MKIGYARVSTKDQHLDMQINALKKEGCDVIYEEKMGATKKRPVFEKLMEELNKGDILVAYKLDRLGRSVIHLHQIMDALAKKGVDVIFVHDRIDTTTAVGKLMFNMVASFAEFERAIIIERIVDGIKAKRKKKPEWGRRNMYVERLTELKMKGFKEKDICKLSNMSRATYFRTNNIFKAYQRNVKDPDKFCEESRQTKKTFDQIDTIVKKYAGQYW
jgi:DNA invertase Pin-like site-specific DNA recombinase